MTNETKINNRIPEGKKTIERVLVIVIDIFFLSSDLKIMIQINNTQNNGQTNNFFFFFVFQIPLLQTNLSIACIPSLF